MSNENFGQVSTEELSSTSYGERSEDAVQETATDESIVSETAEVTTSTVEPEATSDEPQKRVPHSGQSAKPKNIPVDSLNENQRALLLYIVETGPDKTYKISDLAAVFTEKAQDVKQANSWARNALRNLVVGSWLNRESRGVYKMPQDAYDRLLGD